MTPEEHDRMLELCRKIQTETDQQKFSALIYEMSCLLERKQDQLAQNEPSQKPLDSAQS
jgi:hypothetical protein